MVKKRVNEMDERKIEKAIDTLTERSDEFQGVSDGVCNVCKLKSFVDNHGQCWTCSDGYVVRPNSGVIMSPGKFEAESRYVPYMWDVYLMGGSSSDDGVNVTVQVDKDDKRLFPELRRRRSVVMYESDTGLVNEV